MNELQAVVLAGGKGNRLELVDDCQFDIWEDSERALLPVAGIPVFWYPLNVLAKNGITSVLLITNNQSLDKIKESLQNGSLPELPGLNIEVVAPPDEEQYEELGSAKVLQLFADRICRDFILMTGYFVSDISLDNMIKMHYERNSILTCLLSDNACKSITPGPKNQQLYRDFIGICEVTNQLFYLQSEEELEPSVSNIEIKNLINMSRPGRIEFTSAYTDCHVYLMDRRILYVIGAFTPDFDDGSLSSVKVDVIPDLLEKQFKKDKALLAHFRPSNIQKLAYELQHGIDEEPPNPIRIFGYKATSTDASIIGKCNTPGAYLDTTKTLLNLKEPFLSTLKHPPKYPGTKINVIKSHVDESSELGDKEISVVKSSVGKNCSLSSSIKVEESIVMDGVSIDSRSQIKNCIVGRGAKIGKTYLLTSNGTLFPTRYGLIVPHQNCKLQNCVVQAGHTVDDKTTATDVFIREAPRDWKF